MYDLIIIGGGPAGIGAGIYAGRKKIKTLLITDTFGGQSVTSANVENFIGIKSISGFDLANQLEEHLRAREDVEIIDGDLVSKIQIKEVELPNSEVQLPNIRFLVETKSNRIFETKTLLLAMGSKRRKLGVPGEKEFDGKGVAYCGTCDAPMFKGKKVAVVGAGNAGLETAIDLLPYASEIFLIVRGDKIKGDPATFEKIKTNSKVKVYFNTEIAEIFGDDVMSPVGNFASNAAGEISNGVKGVVLKDNKTGEVSKLALDGVFEEIGWLPNSDIVRDLVALGSYGEILIDHKTQKTSRDGIWAAGDITDVLYKQNNISIGDGIKAVLNIHEFLNKSY